MGRLRTMEAKTKPEIKCHTPHQAATTAIAVLPSKKLKIKINPNPEFCIPVSMAMVRFIDSSFLRILLK